MARAPLRASLWTGWAEEGEMDAFEAAIANLFVIGTMAVVLYALYRVFTAGRRAR